MPRFLAAGLWAVVLLTSSHGQSQPPSPAPRKAGQVKQHKAGAKQPEARNDDTSTEKLVAAINQLTAAIAAQNQKQSAEPDQAKPPSQWWFIINSCLVTMFTFALAVLGYFQFRAIDKQGALMQAGLAQTTIAAEAARKSADALITTERAWVIASPTNTQPVVGFIPQSGSNLGAHLEGANTRNIFGCVFKSTGNTPAQLVEVAIRYIMARCLEDVPTEPDYGERVQLSDLPLVKDDSISYIAFLEPNIILSRADLEAVHQQQAFLYAFGIVVYRDVYGGLHETRFGYVYHFPQGGDPREKGLRREGLPAGYNRAT